MRLNTTKEIATDLTSSAYRSRITPSSPKETSFSLLRAFQRFRISKAKKVPTSSFVSATVCASCFVSDPRCSMQAQCCRRPAFGGSWPQEVAQRHVSGLQRWASLGDFSHYNATIRYSIFTAFDDDMFSPSFATLHIPSPDQAAETLWRN